MTRSRLAAGLASFGAGLTFLTASLHLSAYGKVVAQATSPDMRALLATLWMCTGMILIVAALIGVAATPVFVVRRRAFLVLAALIPLSIAACQLYFMGFIMPVALCAVDALCFIVAGELGRTAQPAPQPLAAT